LHEDLEDSAILFGCIVRGNNGRAGFVARGVDACGTS
jgi:hypothetical protein